MLRKSSTFALAVALVAAFSLMVAFATPALSADGDTTPKEKPVALGVSFLVPLDGGEFAYGQFLAAPDGRFYMLLSKPGIPFKNFWVVPFGGPQPQPGPGPGPNPQPQPNPNPNPNPGPSPNPQPQPQPAPAKAIAFYVVYESGDLTADFAKLKDAQAWRTIADAAGLKDKYLLSDDDELEKKLPGVTATARSAGLPCVVFVDANGKASVEKPKTTDELSTAIRKYSGGTNASDGSNGSKDANNYSNSGSVAPGASL